MSLSEQTLRPLVWLVGHPSLPVEVNTRQFQTIPQVLQAALFEQPDLLMVQQAWSDEFRVDEVRALLSACPLTRIVCVYGPLCNSDGRTRSAWPLVTRVSEHELNRRLERELQAIQHNHPPLPWTAGYDELFGWMREATG